MRTTIREMAVNLFRFNAQTLRYLASMTVETSPFKVYDRIPVAEANEKQHPILSRASLDGIAELQHYHIVNRNDMYNVPYEIRYLTHRPITINQSSLVSETPIFGRSLAQIPINVIPGCHSSFMVVTLPDSLIEECKPWWKLVVSSEEFAVIPDVLKIKYNSVNMLNTILGEVELKKISRFYDTSLPIYVIKNDWLIF